MRRRSRNKNQTSPSLFPFLAVLICTMGAIIVLLVLVVKRADVQANAATQANLTDMNEKKAGLRDQLELEESQVETLHELRPDLKNRLAQEKSEYGHMVDHLSRLKEEFNRLQESLTAMNQSRDEQPSSEQLAEEIEQLKRRVADAKQVLDSRKNANQNVKPAFSIIPDSRGGNGTFRRPIFVECNADGVTLQPYGITLKPSDFPRSMGPDNPLDLALVMIRDYWNQIDPNQKEGQPYPLFVVRPTGSRAFAAARKAMKSWVDEFGYELIGADTALEYPQPDPAFSQRLELAVEQARISQKSRVAAIGRQQMLSQIRRLENQGSSGQGFRASSVTGGFVPAGNGLNGGSGSRSTTFASSSRSLPGGGNEQTYSATFGSKGGSGNQGQQQTFDSTNAGNRGTTGSTAENSFSGNSNSFNPQGTEGGQPLANSRFGQMNSVSNSQSQGGQGGPNGGAQNAQSSGGAPGLPAESMARTNGQNWALPSKANNSIQIRKPIKVQVNRDNLQIIELGKGIKTIPFGSATSAAVPGLVEQVWKHIDAWGIAGVNSYWKPTLNLYVAPDAAHRYQDLEKLLSGSGLDLRRAGQ